MKWIGRAVLAGALGLACVHEHRPVRVESLPPALPPPVYVEPGLAVVPGLDQEIFYAYGYYWYRAPDGFWYQTLDPYGAWVWVPPAQVPQPIAVLPPGRYRRWYPTAPAPHGHARAPETEARPAPPPRVEPAPGPAPAPRTGERGPEHHEGRTEPGRAEPRREGEPPPKAGERGHEREEQRGEETPPERR